MKALYLHVNRIAWEPTQKALRSAENPVSGDIKNALAIMIAAEEGDSEMHVEKLVNDIEEHTKRIGVNTIVIYPWVHITSRPAKPAKAFILIKKIVEMLEGKGYIVYRAPFGWYKKLILEIKGHPLAELSRRF